MNASTIKLVALIMSVFTCGCGHAQDVPTVVYKAEFETSKIEGVERIVEEIADKWKLQIFRKDKRRMSILTQGHDAFFVALYLDRDPILFATNVGVGEVLTLGISDYGKLPREDLKRLANDVIEPLRERLNINLQPELKP